MKTFVALSAAALATVAVASGDLQEFVMEESLGEIVAGRDLATIDAIVAGRDLATDADVANFNGFLRGMKFGPVPGPCPALPDPTKQQCFSDASRVTRDIAMITPRDENGNLYYAPGPLGIRAAIDDNLACYTNSRNPANIDNDFYAYCDQVGSSNERQTGIIRSGLFWTSSLFVRDLQFGSLGIAPRGTANANSIPFTVTARELFLDLYTPVKIQGLVTEPLPLKVSTWFGPLPFTISSLNLGDSKPSMVAEIKRGNLGNSGFGLSSDLKFAPNKGQSLSTDLPRYVDYEFTNACQLTFSLNAFTFPGGTLTSIPGWLEGIALFFIKLLLDGIVKGMACAVYRGMFWVTRDSTTNYDTFTPGLANNLLKSAYDKIYQYVKNQPLVGSAAHATIVKNFDSTTLIQKNRLPAEQEKAMIFKSDSIFPKIFKGVNDILGSRSSTDPSKLVINEFVERFLPGGNLIVDDLKNPIYNVQVPASAFVFEQASGPFNFRAEVQGFRLGGLNTFKDTFKALDAMQTFPGYESTKYSLRNAFSLSRLTAEATVKVTLTPGSWVTAGGANKVFTTTTTLRMNVANPSIDSFLGLLFNWRRIEDKMIGTLLDYPAGQEVAALNCSLQTVYAAGFSSLRATGSVSEVKVLSSDFKKVIENAARLFISSSEGFLTDKLPSFAEELARPLFNEYAENYLKTLPACYKYETKTAEDIILLDKNALALSARDALAKAIGGTPVQRSDFDINALVLYAIDEYKADIETALGNGTFTLLKNNAADYRLVPVVPKSTQTALQRWETKELATAFSLDKVSYMFAKQVEVRNLNSIYALSLEAVSANEMRAVAKIGTGQLLNAQGQPEVTKPIEVAALVGGSVKSKVGTVLISEQDNAILTGLFDLQVDTRAVLEIDQNKAFQLKFGDLQYPVCVLSTMRRYGFYNDRQGLKLNTTNFYATVKRSAPGSFASSGSKMGIALEQLQGEVNDQVLKKSTNQVRYIMQRFAKYAEQVVQDSVESNMGKITAQNCRNYEYKINSTAINALLQLPSANFNETIFEKTSRVQYWPYTDSSKKATVPEADAQGWEERGVIVFPADQDVISVFDINRSPLVTTLREKLNTQADPETLRKVANTTFGQSFLKVDPTDEDQIHLELDFSKSNKTEFANDDFIEGLKIRVEKFSVRNVEAAKFALFKEYARFTEGGPKPSFTTAHEIVFDNTLDVEVQISIETAAAFVGRTGAPSKEVFVFKFKVDKPRIDAVTYLAIDLDRLNKLEVDRFVKVSPKQEFSLREDLLDCILSPVFEGGAGLPGFQLTYETIQEVSILPLSQNNFETSDLFTDGFAKVTGVAIEALLAVFQDQAADITQGPIRKLLDKTAKDLVLSARDARLCPDAGPLVLDDPYLDIKGSQQIQALYEQLEREAFDPESPLNVNNFLAVFFEGETTYTSTGKRLPLQYNDLTYGTLEVNLKNIKFVNIDTVDTFVLFNANKIKNYKNPKPEELPYLTRTEVGLGGQVDPVTNKTKRIAVSFTANLTADGLFREREGMSIAPDGSLRVEDTFEFTFLLDRVDIMFELLTKIDITKLMKVRLAGFLDLASYPCLLEMFPEGGLSVKYFNLSTGDIQANMECKGVCNSPLLKDFEGAAPVTNPEINKILTQTLKTGIDALNAFIQSPDFEATLQEEIAFSPEGCIQSIGLIDVPAPKIVKVAEVMGIIGLSGLFVSFIGFAFLVPLHMKRRDQVMKLALLNTASKGQMGQADFVLQEQKLKSAFYHPAIPLFVRFALPIWAVVNMLFFVTAALLTVGASVQLKLGLFGDETNSLDLMSFTLESSIDDMWNAGTIFLSLAIAILSGAWPYVKNILLMFCWFAPPTVIGTHKRGEVLEILDALGKWSLIDVYVLILLCVGFRFYIESSMSPAFLELFGEDIANAVTVDVVVQPGWGIYGFLIGAIGSLLANHLMIYWNRRAVAEDQVFEDKLAGCYVEETPTPRVAMITYKFNSADAKGRIYGFGPGSKLAVATLLSLAGLFIVVGSFLKILTFEFSGLAGLAIGLVDKDLTRVSYSSVEIATSISRGTDPGFASRFGIFFLQLIYLAFAFLVPLALLIAYAYLWMVPLTLATQKKVVFVTEILNAWEALLILVVSFFGCILQISDLAQFIVQNSTGTLCLSIQNFLLNRNISERDSKCFDVAASMEVTGFVLVVGTLFMVIVSLVMSRIVKSVVEDRLRANKRKDCHCPAEPSGTKCDLTALVLRNCTVPVARINLNNTQAVGSFRNESPSSRAISNPAFEGSKRASIDV